MPSESVPTTRRLNDTPTPDELIAYPYLFRNDTREILEQQRMYVLNQTEIAYLQAAGYNPTTFRLALIRAMEQQRVAPEAVRQQLAEFMNEESATELDRLHTEHAERYRELAAKPKVDEVAGTSGTWNYRDEVSLANVIVENAFARTTETVFSGRDGSWRQPKAYNPRSTPGSLRPALDQAHSKHQRPSRHLIW